MHRRPHPGHALRRTFGVRRGGVERPEMPDRHDAEADRRRALRLHPPQDRPDLRDPRLGDDIDSTLERGIYGYRLDDDD